MHPYPHQYNVDASGGPGGKVALSSAGLPSLQSAPPAEFDGPGDEWSPETLLVAAAADCFILTFRAIARASNLTWTSLRCSANGQLDRREGTTRFTAMKLHASLTIPPGTDADKARRLLEKSDKVCLITNSLTLAPTLTSEVIVADVEADAARPSAA